MASDGNGTVKKERQDEQEINDMARKIREQNRAKVNSIAPNGLGYANPTGLIPGMGPNGQMAMARPGQPMIGNYFNGRQGAGQAGGSSTVTDEKDKVDGESRKGRFGWCEFEKNHIPFIFRYSNEKFTSVRMVERKFLSRFLSVLPPEVNSCHCIRSYYITEVESKLLNEINLKHTDCAFGKEAFTTKDLVVRLSDAEEFYRFLDLCFKKLVLKKSNASDRCGFFRINGESVVPYTVREGVKFVPLFYFEGETDHLKLKSDSVDGWDLAYLKFCCKVQGIRNELFASEVCRVVALEEIKGHFPSGTTFEDYWPAKGSIEPVNTQRMPAGQWTQKPPSASSSSSTTAAATAASMQREQQSKLSGYAAAAAAQQQAVAAAAAYHSGFDYLRNAASSMLNASAANYASTQQQQATAAAQFSSQMAAVVAQQQQVAAAAAAAKSFPGKLTQIKEFPMERSHQPAYKLQKALIDQKIVPCINVRPYVFHDLMMTLPDFVKNFCHELSIERGRHMLQDILKVILYKGNRGHQEILKSEGKCLQFDPVPLVLVKDIMNYMPQMKYMLNNLASTSSSSSHHHPSKRMKV